MSKKEIELIIDLLIYLDVSLNIKNKNIDFISGVSIVNRVLKKRKDIDDPQKRHKAISNLITRLEALKND